MNSTLINCEDEKIQFLNQIQDFGYLIGISRLNNQIQFYSENIHDIFGEGLCLNDPVDQFIDISFIDFDDLKEGQYIRKDISLGTHNYHVIVYSCNDFIYIELEENKHHLDYSLFFKYAELLEFSKNEKDNWNTLVDSIKSLIGYDRVMIYKFLDDNSGVVIAEAVNSNVDAYLGMHFPEFDIPAQARALYLKKKNRLVSDVNSKRINIISVADVKIDLTYSEIRALSPIHLQYLKNFNSQSSFSISIIVENKLWGIVACQSIKPKHIPITLRKKAEILVNFGKESYVNFQNKNILRIKDDYKQILIQLKEGLILREDFNDIMNYLEVMLAFSESDGLAFLEGSQFYSCGDVPDLKEILRIKDWAITNNLTDLYFSHSFYKQFKDELNLSSSSAGVAFKFLDLKRNYFLIWFREPITVIRKWAGKPEKEQILNSVDDEEMHSFSPRANFGIWLDQVNDQSNFWGQKDLIVLEEVNKIIIETIHIKSEKIKSLYEQLQDMNEELDTFSYTMSHDLRTPLTVIKLNCQNLQRSLSLDDLSSQKIGNIIKEVDVVSNMMNEIFQLSKTKKVDIKVSLVNAKELIDKLAEYAIISYSASKTNIEIINLIDFYCDKTMAYEIFLNIINNAVKYSVKAENPHVIIRADLEDDFVVYRIKDNGIGIENHERYKMFKLFSRMDNTNGYEGSGVGLSIVKRMMDRLDGSIDYISEIGKGTEFILKFKNRL